ncbi:hypothetical protein [Streptacidiphilus cavernicola]|uniref:ATP-binding protein n=1 Tax=Streptacidiphilus cavernicola TaxID=3342716 RepID=A0ABV6W5L9_9ACTN
MRLELTGHHPMHRGDLHISADSEPGLVIDARGLGFASPLDLTAAIAIAHDRARTGTPTALILPEDANVTSYLQRMDLLRHLPPGTHVTGPLPAEERLDHSRRLMEITPLTPRSASAVAQRIGLVATTTLGPRFGALTFKAVGELIDNAVSHGLSGPGAFICAQTYTGRTTEAPGLEIALCDTGIGVLEHLRRNPQYAHMTDHAQALRCALEPGVTGTGEMRGNGLPDLLAETGRAGTTRLLLRSGTGIVVAERDPGTPPMDDTCTTTRVSGTWAQLRVMFPA